MYLEYVWRGSFMAIKVRGKASFEVSFTVAGQRYRRSFRCRAAALEWEGRAKAALERGQAIPAAGAERSGHHDLTLGGLLFLCLLLTHAQCCNICLVQDHVAAFNLL